MNTQELKLNYKKLLNKAAKANGRKETVSYLNLAAKIKSKLYSNNKVSRLPIQYKIIFSTRSHKKPLFYQI